MKKNCDVCKSFLLSTTISLGKQPLCDDLRNLNSSLKCKLYPIKLKICKKCLTVNQLHKVKQKLLFPKDYNYRAKLTQDVLNGMKDLVNSCDNLNKKSNNKVVLDVGCNDGSLLDFFKKKKYQTIGIEPTNAVHDVKKIHLTYNSTFNLKTIKKIIKKYPKIDFVAFTNVFAHIPNFKEVIDCLKILKNHTKYIVIENHYLGSVLKKGQFDTFYQEHPRTYSVSSFKQIAYLIGLNITKIQFPKRYGGNLRVFLSKNKKEISKKKLSLLISREKNFILEFKKLKEFIKKWKNDKIKFFKKLNKKKVKIFGKAFPGRASILINYLGIDEKIIPIIFEQNKSKKINKYVPGTKIKILSDKFIKKKVSNRAVFINFAWHIDNEIKKYLRDLKINNKVYNIINSNDFKQLNVR
jgi:hypothetical protein